MKSPEFGNVLARAVSMLDVKKIATNGFRGCGLVPFDCTALNQDKILNNSKSANQIIPSGLDFNLFVAVLERRLSPLVQQKFFEDREKSEWTGDVEYAQHFYFWQYLKNQVEIGTIPNIPNISGFDERCEGNLDPPDSIMGTAGEQNFEIFLQEHHEIQTQDDSDFVSGVSHFEIEPTENGQIVSLAPGSFENNTESSTISTSISHTDEPKNAKDILKEYFFCPEEISPKVKETSSVIPINIVTSEEWRIIKKEKLEAKKQLEEQKKANKQARELKRKLKQEEDARKKEIREEKRKIKESEGEKKKIKKMKKT
ncbi:putative autophagy-related protein 11 [Phlebotomus papatasi]|uniref:putative autophagy-related protein 11 n=1 Tax=Phlebotomus papatasi TaxID=29031 RepID=UPI0024835E08|nr:putative autophagy-related protein 11 [Phlebotomus papatasi]